ncbi:MAG TPA: hypothetical protein VHJ20_06330 [Polyangia bacterium]|nr:hypothetical protein [Polyangia bacterium]
MKRSASFLLGCVGLVAGCGGRALVGTGATPPDGGAGTDSGSLSSARSFDVTAALTVTPPKGDEAGWLDAPKTAKITFVVDDEPGHVVVGANGFFASSVVTEDAAGARHVSFTIAIPFDRSCSRVTTLAFDDVTFTEANGTLSASGSGQISYQTGGDIWTADLAATFAGVPDATPPAIVSPTGTVDPLASLTLNATEPLPSTVTARLVGQTSGDVLPLFPATIGTVPAAAPIVGFYKPEVALRFDETYALEVDGLVDFAGHAATAPPAVLTTPPTPPLASPDGFESVTGDTFGGAGVLDGGPLTPISGKKSLLLNTGFGGGFGFLPYALGPSLAVRVPVPAGAKVLRFSRQLIAPDSTQGSMFVGAIRLGAPWHTVETQMNVAATDFTQTTLPGNGDVYVTSVKTIELPLPEGAGSEITFEITGVTFACGLPPPPTVLVIDDLRAE